MNNLFHSDNTSIDIWNNPVFLILNIPSHVLNIVFHANNENKFKMFFN